MDQLLLFWSHLQVEINQHLVHNLIEAQSAAMLLKFGNLYAPTQTK